MSEQTQDFVVTARKWRPLRFGDVVGQEHITNTLRNALLNNRLHHAFLFCGPRGVGKTTTARIISRAINCLNLLPNGEPCNECENCKSVILGRSLDIIEIDGASNNGVDDVRQLRENAKYPPSTGKYKMYIIDEVHMLSNSAFNALLKTLEEPPAHLMFVFATTESHKVPATIISRCQRFDFRRMEIENIISQLRTISNKENIRIDDKSLYQIAKKADGSMRDSQSIFDQVVAFCGTDIKFSEVSDALHLIDEDFFFRMSDCIINGDLVEAFNISNEIIKKGYELQETLHGLLEHFRNILTVLATGNTSLIDTSEVYKLKYSETAAITTKSNVLRYVQVINKTDETIRFAAQPRIKFELALATMASLGNTLEIKQLIEEIRNINEFPNNQTEQTATASVQKKNIEPKIKIETKVENYPVEKKAIEQQQDISSSYASENIHVNNPDDKSNLKVETATEKKLIELFNVVREKLKNDF